MTDPDGFGAYYAERLWQLLPAVYRADDTAADGSAGPLRELLDRVGGQVAVVRRSLDRLWADQSIETCDDWVVPYIGDLLGTNLVNGLARAQRLDVAKTIHYRRRKGTLAVLEELALDVTSDVTNWDVHLVEGFRRLARTRHGLDPMVGPGAFPAAAPVDVRNFLEHEGLVGPLTGTPAGGLADLRSVHGARLADSPFDEYFHSADLRAGAGALGHFGIQKLLVFLWRLASFPVTGGTPVAVAGCDGTLFSFDPTGRRVPLFLPPAPPEPDDFADVWTSANELQVPGPITASLEAALADSAGSSAPPESPYPFSPTGSGAPPSSPYGYAVAGATLAGSWPELGLFSLSSPVASPPGPLSVDYQYGFSGLVGAGPYDRLLLGAPPAEVGTAPLAVSGGSGLDPALADVAPSGTVSIGDSLTYDALAPVGSSVAPIASVLVAAAQQTPPVRPVLRPSSGEAWVFTGAGEAELVLDGLLISGCDVVLRGSFASVRLTACTLDPGTAAPAPSASGPGGSAAGSPPYASPPDASPPAASPPLGSALALAVDGRPLVPSTLWIEADPAAPPGSGGIAQLLVDHCILGPVRTRYGGAVESVTISDSIVQAIPTALGPSYGAADVYDPALLAAGLNADDPLADALRAAMPAAAVAALGSAAAPPLPQAVIDGLNALVAGPNLYDATLLAVTTLSPDVQAMLASAPPAGSEALAALNRALLDEVFPVALGLAALALSDATVALTRVSVLGRIAVHRLSASDSVLWDFAAVEDAQDGCVRFCAYTAGSRLPGPFASVVLPATAAIFTSTDYGDPGYAQLLDGADAQVAGGGSISAGADSGSEMGAFSANLAPLKEQAIRIKYAEYMPLGLTPVIVHVT